LYKIFTIDIDGKPTTALNAPNLSHARAICALPDFRFDMKGLTSGGTRFCTDASCITARPANEAELAAFVFATRGAAVTDTMTFVFLINVDRSIPNAAVAQLREHNRR
jgi:hypothetical protein